jgi:hypothetical protein
VLGHGPALQLFHTEDAFFGGLIASPYETSFAAQFGWQIDLEPGRAMVTDPRFDRCPDTTRCDSDGVILIYEVLPIGGWFPVAQIDLPGDAWMGEQFGSVAAMDGDVVVGWRQSDHALLVFERDRDGRWPFVQELGRDEQIRSYLGMDAGRLLFAREGEAQLYRRRPDGSFFLATRVALPPMVAFGTASLHGTHAVIGDPGAEEDGVPIVGAVYTFEVAP